jgi:LPPG:FO 2-phospho-L-lactate transferase
MNDIKNAIDLKIVALAGGVGGAKLAHGLSMVLPPDNLTVIVNTGDDFNHLGLEISPDIDTVMYTLAGMANPDTGWGLNNESWNTLEGLRALDAPTWFQIGDRDLATHLSRTYLKHEGYKLSEIMQKFSEIWGIKVKIFPMSDEPVRTVVHTRDGRRLSFQEYFVKERYQPCVEKFTFEGIEHAKLFAEVTDNIDKADLVVICPSNPWVSIDPILKVGDIRDRLRSKIVIAVSPFVGDKALKGPAAKMFDEMGIIPCVETVAEHYKDFLTSLVIDTQDLEKVENLIQLGIIPYVTQTIMCNDFDRKFLARRIIELGNSLISRSCG